MNTRRTARVARAIQEVVGTCVLFELKDPRIRNVTVLRAEVTGDLRNAKVYVSVMGDEQVQSLSLRGLNSARGFLQAKVADRLQTRYTPVLQFVLDDSVKRSAATSALIRKVMAESAAEAESRSVREGTGGESAADGAGMDGVSADGAGADGAGADGAGADGAGESVVRRDPSAADLTEALADGSGREGAASESVRTPVATVSDAQTAPVPEAQAGQVSDAVGGAATDDSDANSVDANSPDVR